MDEWRTARWPLSYLDATIRWRLANCLDLITATGLGYPRFAAALGYLPQEIDLIQVRGAANAGNSNSVTYALLLDYEMRRGSIQGVQHALEDMGHIAAEIIPPYIERLLHPQTGYLLPYNGHQNSDISSCICSQCRTQLPDYRPINTNSLSPQSDTGKRRQRARPTSIGYVVPISNLSNPPNSVSPIWNNGCISAQHPSANRTPSAGTANPSVERIITGQHSSPAINSNINDNLCSCEDCRLKSDPEQTQRLTLRSNPKAPCMLDTHSYQNTEYGVHGQGYDRSCVSQDRLSSRLSQLYLDSEESQETSSENRETSNETYMKNVFSESDRVQNNVSSSKDGESPADVNNQTGSMVPNRNSERRPLCSKSDIGEHRLGDQIDACPVCRNNSGTRTKTGSKSSTRPRNASAPEGTEPGRYSWPNTSRKINNKTGNMHSVMSDSILLVPRLSSSNSQHSEGDHVIEETLYEIISSHNSTTSGNRPVHCVGSGEGASSTEFYNDSRNVPVEQTVTRNIVPSDSSNCSGPPVRASSDSPPVGASSVSFPVGASSVSPPVRASRNVSAQNRCDFVFVTYTWNGMTVSESFMKEILDLCLALREAGILVKIDMDEISYAKLRLNRLDWIDKCVREAKYVIVCISPTYSTDVREPDPTSMASPSATQLNARYIFDKLREEYYSNQCQNRRVIPVMFTNYGTTMQHVPSCMCSTLVYSYPDRIDSIIAAVLGKGRYEQS